MCSSSSIIWIGSMPGALFQDRCRCASIRPGISVAPMPSITVAPVAAVEVEPIARGAARDLLDAVALDQHLAGVGIFAGRIEDAHIGEEHVAGAVAVPAMSVAVPAVVFVSHGDLPVVPRASRHTAASSCVQRSTRRRKSASSWLLSCTFSIVAQWPQRSMVLNVAPLILSASACATLTGLTVSASPVDQQRRRVDQPQIDGVRAWPAPRRNGHRIPDPGA